MRFQVFFILAAAARAYAPAEDGGSRPAPKYNYRCDGLPNGNYIHPTDCTRFIMCSNDLAYEFDCADCNEEDNPGRCREGRTVFDPDLGLCNWADGTECRVGGEGDVPDEEDL